MDFKVGQTLFIDPYEYYFDANPKAPNIPYWLEGSRGIVYQLVSHTGNLVALKVLKPRYRSPRLPNVAERLRQYATLPGLLACERTVLTAATHGRLLNQYPDLLFAMVMPWIEGQTWREIQSTRKPLTSDQALNLGRSLAGILNRLEERGLAHCDLAATNLIVSLARPENQPDSAHLVDLEDMYVPGLYQPEALSIGQSGYTHRTAREGRWSPEADRFAGAIILAELLGWSNAGVVQASWGERFFAHDELGQNSNRYQALAGALETQYGQPVRELFDRTWYSETLADCPAFGEWASVLPGGKNLSTIPLESQAGAVPPLGQARPPQEDFLVQPVNVAFRPAAPQPEWQTLAQYQGQPQPTAAASYPSTYQVPGQTAAVQQDNLAMMFDSAVLAMRNSDWYQAEGLLESIVTANPAYQRGGRYASALLDHVRGQLAPPPSKTWTPWLILGVAAIAVVICVAGIIGYAVVAPLLATPTATNTAVTSTVTATSELATTTVPIEVLPPTNTFPPNALPQASDTPLPTFTPFPTDTPYPTDTPRPPDTPTQPPQPTTGTLRIRNASGSALWIGTDQRGGSVIAPGSYLEFYDLPINSTVNVKYCKVDQQGNVTGNCNYASYNITSEFVEGSVR